MRVREAVRTCRFIGTKGGTNIYQFLRTFCYLYFDYTGTHYRLLLILKRKDSPDSKQIKIKCAFKALRLGYSWLVDTISCVQGTFAIMADEDGVGERLMREIKAPRLHIDWTSPAKHQKLTLPEDPEGIEKLKNEFIEENNFDLSNYHHSANIEGDDATKAIKMYFDETHSDYHEDAILHGLVAYLAVTPPDDLKCEKLDILAALDQNVSDSASGQVAVDQRYGLNKGKKLEMQVAAAVTCRDCGLIDHKYSKKPEVLKKCKKCRYVVSGAYKNVIIGKHYFGHVVNKHDNIWNGRSIGLSRTNGNHLKPLLKIFIICREQYNRKGKTLEWEDFLRYTDGEDDPEGIVPGEANEMDCQAWEYTVNNESVLFEEIGLLAGLDFNKADEEDLSYIASFMAHIHAYPIKLEGNNAAWVLSKTASGSYTTLYGNGARHEGGYCMVLGILSMHGYRWTKKGCKCPVCASGEFPDEPVDMDKLELAFVSSTKLGDDDFAADLKRLSVLLARAMDLCIGTKTISEVKPFYGQESAKYLQVQLTKNQGYPVAFRARERLLAKLLKMPRDTPEACAASIISAIMDLGYDPELNEKLREFHARVSKLITDKSLYEEEVDKYKMRGSGADYQSLTQDEVLIMQSGFTAPLAELKREYERYRGI